MRKWLLISSVTVLGLAAGLQIYSAVAFTHTSSLGDKKLADVLPGKDSGWKFTESPMGATEASEAGIQSVLKYDEAIVRNYEKDGLRLSVYAAYWKPAKAPYSIGGVHHPDSCWVLNGMAREFRKFGHTHPAGNLTLKPFEYGRYAQDGRATETIWWHLVGGQPNRYETQSLGWTYGFAGRVERTAILFGDLLKYGLDGQKEQFFVRITPPPGVSFDDLWEDGRFQDMLKQLEPLGILAKK